MTTGRSSTRVQPINASRRTWSALRWPMCLLAPMLAALAAGVVFASTSYPDFIGTTPENVSHSAQDRAWQPDIAADSSGRIVVVWSDVRTDGRDIYFTDKDGGEWSTPQAVSETAATSRSPDVLSVGDQNFVTWVEPPTATYETEIGTGETRLISSPVALVDAPPRLAASTDRLHSVFSAGPANTPDIYHASRPLIGSWTAAERVYTSTASRGSWWPALAADPDSGTLHAVWENNKSVSMKTIMYISGTVSGADVGWSPAITLSTGITESIYPDIAVDSAGNVHVVWGEIGEQGYYEQYVRYTRYDAASGSWIMPAVRIDPNPVRVNEESPTNVAPKLAVWGDEEVEVCVVWYGFQSGDPSAEEVLVRCSSNGGDDWSSAATENVSRSTSHSGWEVSMRPSVAFDASGKLHVVWQERAGDIITEDYEIYYSARIYQVFLPLVTRGSK